MFIFVTYRDAPELSHTLRRSSSETDLAVEKKLLVNPYCPVRIMMEYIRKKCRLGLYTQFDLCDESGALKGLFNFPTYAYATEMFVHKKSYYIIVIRQESDKRISVLPQLNHENRLYEDLKMRANRYLLTGEFSPQSTPSKVTPPASKSTPPPAAKSGKKK